MPYLTELIDGGTGILRTGLGAVTVCHDNGKRISAFRAQALLRLPERPDPLLLIVRIFFLRQSRQSVRQRFVIRPCRFV